MDLDAYFKEHPMGDEGLSHSVKDGFKSGFVALVGRPNSGKSTLTNAVVGSKVAITSRVAQTTRRRVRGVLTNDDFQLVLVDTPGLHKPKDVLGEELNKCAIASFDDVDAIAMLIDASKPVGSGDRWVASQLASSKAPLICVLTKKDLVDDDALAAQIEAASELARWDALVCLSSKNGYNVDAFVEECERLLPEGPLWFPASMQSDVDDELVVAETVREKVLRTFRDEVPHSIGVQTDFIDYDHERGLYRIEATIYTERDSQKAMLIGKGGSAVKSIGTMAREDLEEILGARIHLGLSVKARPGWRSDQAQLERFGYTS